MLDSSSNSQVERVEKSEADSALVEERPGLGSETYYSLRTDRVARFELDRNIWAIPVLDQPNSNDSLYTLKAIRCRVNAEWRKRISATGTSVGRVPDPVRAGALPANILECNCRQEGRSAGRLSWKIAMNHKISKWPSLIRPCIMFGHAVSPSGNIFPIG